jgi:hypothetical protein
MNIIGMGFVRERGGRKDVKLTYLMQGLLIINWKKIVSSVIRN